MVDALGHDNLFGFLKTAMDAASMGHQMNASNLANIDTPGYVARRMNFEDIMRDYEEQAEMMPRNRPGTDRRPMPPAAALNFKDYIIEEDTTHLTQRFDGNNVDLDKEMAHMAKMRGRFQLASQLMNRKIRMLNETIMSR